MSAACAPARTAVYRRRRPERTALYRTVQMHLATWLELSCDLRQGASGPAHVEREFRHYLECRILAHGFARARCAECGHDFPIAYIPFFQQYWPIEGVPDRLPEDFFDMDLNAMIRLTFYSNGYNWEKYLLWINTRYFQRYGRYYRPLIEILYRYNHKHRLEWFRMNPACLSDELYQDHRDGLSELRATLRRGGGPPPPKGLTQWLAQIAAGGT